MNPVKATVKVIYGLLRILFFPLVLLFRPTGVRRESVIGSSTVAVFILVIQPIVGSRLGAGYAVASTGLGAILGYFLLMWGKEFEEEEARAGKPR